MSGNGKPANLYISIILRFFLRQAHATLAQVPHHDASTFTIVLHSRHSNAKNPGADVEAEMKCLREIVQTGQSTGQVAASGSAMALPAGIRGVAGACLVLILSDRAETRARVADFAARELGCDICSVAPDAGESWSPEHGPFAGAGAVEDLALAAHATGAVVSSSGSSMSMLVREVAAFAALTRGDNPREPAQCGVWHR